MKAIIVEQYGEPDVLKLRETTLTRPAAGQAFVRLFMAGVNFIDIYHRRGSYPLPLPFTPGREAAGIVEAVAPDVTTVKVGDRVTFVASGSYAQGTLVPADILIPLPTDFSYEQGAAFPLQGMTAHYLLHEFRRLKAGDVVLIHAAAGGMGLLLVQWARHLGVRVIGTVSTDEKAESARQAGADEIILYSRQDFVAETKRLTSGHGADLIIDGVGGTTFAGNLDAAATRGNIVIYGAASGPANPIAPNSLMTRALSVSGGHLQNFMQTRTELLGRANDVIQGIREGWLKLRFRVMALSQAAEAHRLLENRQTVGKLILDTSN